MCSQCSYINRVMLKLQYMENKRKWYRLKNKMIKSSFFLLLIDKRLIYES